MGPIAPKDPVKKRPAIYLMYDKEIFAQPFKDGKGMCFLFMDINQRDGSAVENVSFSTAEPSL